MQVRCLLEGADPQDMLNNWHTMLPTYMQKWGLQRIEVCASFAAQFECKHLHPHTAQWRLVVRKVAGRALWRDTRQLDRA